jgi:hypothetical protein
MASLALEGLPQVLEAANQRPTSMYELGVYCKSLMDERKSGEGKPGS